MQNTFLYHDCQSAGLSFLAVEAPVNNSMLAGIHECFIQQNPLTGTHSGSMRCREPAGWGSYLDPVHMLFPISLMLCGIHNSGKCGR